MHGSMLGAILAKQRCGAQVQRGSHGQPPHERHVAFRAMARPGWAAAAVAVLAAWFVAAEVHAAKVVLRDGRTIEGRIAPLPSMMADPNGVNDGGATILMIDDDLRRVFVPQRRVEEVHEGAGEALEKFKIWQKLPSGGQPVSAVGRLTNISPWNEYGRRSAKMRTNRGDIDIIQGITEITPRYTTVTSLRQYKWDMRIATSSIPRDALQKILEKAINKNDLEQRLRLVRFYLQGEWFDQARKELTQVLEDFPEAKAEYARVLRDITQLSARLLLTEARIRERAGQSRLVYSILSQFPSDGVAGETLQEVARMLHEQQQLHAQGKAVLEQLDAHVAEYARQNTALAAKLQPIRDEIFAELTVHTLDRMAAYQQFANDPQMAVDQKLALAISGWLLGPQSASDNLSTSLSLYEVRNLIRKYMNLELALERELLLRDMQKLEGSTPRQVALLLAHMKPPKETEPRADGFYDIQVPGGVGRPPQRYLVQLPPEYDPYRRYPAIVTLHGASSTPEMQLDWWAGAREDDKPRFGQAMRHGYIVIAPVWCEPHQVAYQFSLREHLAVLDSLRDACRRFSIDTDRVFLSGHSMGGDAAWDIGLAHPDLWAGVIPIGGVCDRFPKLYWENAAELPMYLVSGEFDGEKSVQNASSLDRYMRRGFPVTVVEFLGRGHEHFSDEILNLFDWMGRLRRNFFPKEFTVSTLRPWDNYFWWAEVLEMPRGATIDPSQWPFPRGTRAVSFNGKILENNSIFFRGGGGRLAIWLSPEVVNFDQAIRLNVNGRTETVHVQPDLETLLEDARTRADRQHPFWSRVLIGGRTGVTVGSRS